MRRILVVLLSGLLALAAAAQELPLREFRGAWLHIVGNTDMQKMSQDEIRTWLTSTLDSLQKSGCNAVFFQVRPEADAFYINLNDSSMTPGGEMAGAAGVNDKQHHIGKSLHPRYAPNDDIIQEYADHHLPLRLGLSFRYQLTQKWSVETGLTYTYLSSDIKRKVAANPFLFQIEQKLHYVGVPVNAEYLLLENKHFNVYASAGTLVEKMVRGRRNDEYNSQSEKVSIHPLQFSLNCAAGAEWKMNRLLSV